MSNTIAFVINVLRTNNGESISSACTFMLDVSMNANSHFLFLLSSQMNQSTELGSSTGMVTRYCLNYHWWYDVAFNCFYCKIELQGLDELPVLIQILLKTYFFLPPLVRKPLPLLIFAQTTDGDG